MAFFLIIILFVVLMTASILIRRKNVDIIVLGNLQRKNESCPGLRHIFFCFADHFEPLWNNADKRTAIFRVAQWLEQYPAAAGKYRDGGGKPPQHTFFYPQEEYIPECLEMLKELKSRGFGDVEVHLHHDNETSEAFKEKILSFKEALFSRHGLLRRDSASGVVHYGFIHGNWALDDSGAGGRYCGVRDEITILKQTGCYADFTYPSAPHPTQPPIVNRIYYATDDPHKPKSHHRGVDAAFGAAPPGDLLMVQGPLAINWKRRRKLIFPAIENGDVTDLNPPSPERVDLWIKTAVSVRKWPGWIFVKIHTHGAQEKNSGLLLGHGIDMLHEYLQSRYNDGMRYILHYVTAWEMYNCVKVLEEGDEAKVSRVEGFDYGF